MHVHLSTRVMFLKSLLRSRLTYGCHTWRPTPSEMSKIESTYQYFLRCMVWNNEKLFEITGSSTIQEFVNQQQIN